MKNIIAIIQPHKLEVLRSALMEIGVMGITATEVSGFGRQKGHIETYRGAEYVVDFVQKVRLEMVVPESHVEGVISCICDNARSGKFGDGKIFVLPIEQALRIRTGDLDDQAIS
jgi:nitrogen regulatory protein P-II 1